VKMVKTNSLKLKKYNVQKKHNVQEHKQQPEKTNIHVRCVLEPPHVERPEFW